MKLYVGFGSALLVSALLLTFVQRPISERLRTLHDDGLRIAEVHERIAHDPRAIDIAFIGTSHTMNGIDDQGIQENLAKNGLSAEVTNLGAMWMGRDLHLMLVKQLLAHKKPKMIILEINEHEPPYGHPLMPYVALASDMFCCSFWADFNFPKMYLLFLKEQLYGGLAGIWPAANAKPAPTRTWQYGWDPIDRTWNPDVRHRRSLGDRLEDAVGRGPREAAYRLVSTYGNQTVKQIVETARANGVPVVFLYLPEYAFAADPAPDSLALYNDLGPILLPPPEIVRDSSNWGDFAHLNRAGSLKIVPYLSTAIADYFRAGIPTTRQRSFTSSAGRS